MPSVRKYGLDWPEGIHPIFIDLVLAKHWREEPYKHGNLLDPREHLLRAATELFSPSEFQVSKWTEEHAQDFTTEQMVVVWGPAASSKSNDFGLFILLDWMTDPTQTLSILASTTSDMLQLRSFEAVIRYFRILKRHAKFLIPGIESKTRLAIINAEDPDSPGVTATVKASVKGVAVHAGTLEEARANLQGAHLPYTRLVLDELSQMKEAAMEARHNLSIGCKDFRLFGLCNPDSLFDLACRYSEPLEGWSSVNPDDSTYWRTRWGCVRRHDGLHSPGLVDPVKYPYTIKQTEIDRIMAGAGGNMDAPEIWTMVRGWPPPQGKEQTILTGTMLTTFHMRDPVVWGQAPTEPILIAGLDPAFTSGGDAAVLQPAKVGYEAATGLLVIAFEPEIIIPIKASSQRPDVYQVVDFVLDWADEHDFNFKHLAVDESGTQRVGDMIEVEGIRRFQRPIEVCRVSFGSLASEFPVSVRREEPARKVYGNQVTELWYAMQEFGIHNQVRALPFKAAEQFCRRRVLPRRPKVLETKADMKKRIKRSPDQGDAAACALAVVRWVLQTVPGSSLIHPSGDQTAKRQSMSPTLLRMYDVDNPERSYQDPPV